MSGWEKLAERGDLRGAVYAYIVGHPNCDLLQLATQFEPYADHGKLYFLLVLLTASGRLNVRLEAK